MVHVNLKGPDRYPPLGEKTPEELFDLAVEMSQALDNIQVTTPTADHASDQDQVVLDSRLMKKKGVKVF